MKTIVETSSGLSKYLLDDDVTLTVTATEITVGYPAQFIVSDLNNTNSVIVNNVTNLPVDWKSCKYTFDGTTWTLNPDWVDPEG
jgi:hypothetical protein